MSDLRGSIFSVPLSRAFEPGAEARPLDSEGQPISGYRRVTDADLPVPAEGETPERHVVYAASGMPLLEDALPGGYDAGVHGPWTVPMMLAAYPSAAPYVLMREFTVPGDLDETGELRVHRAKMARPLPPGAVVLEEHLVDFHWTDDAP